MPKIASEQTYHDAHSTADLEKIKSNWRKALLLFEKKEWSGAVLRAATTIEIAANLVIKEELQIKRHLDSDFVASLLLWANGIHGKFTRIILPILKNTERHSELKRIQEQVFYIDEERNSIVHSGISKQRRTAEKVLGTGREIIEKLIREYYDHFELKGFKIRQASRQVKSKKRTIQQYTLFPPGN